MITIIVEFYQDNAINLLREKKTKNIKKRIA